MVTLKKLFIRSNILLFVLLYAATCRAQKPFIRDFSLIETSTGVVVNALAQDRSGYIWIGTDIGLVRFNGKAFVQLQDSVHRPVTAVSACGENVWVGYNNGEIGAVNNLSVKEVKIVNGPASAITSLFSNEISSLVAATEEQGIFVIINNIAIPLNTSNGLSDNFTYGFSVMGPERIIAGSDVGINDISIAQNKPSVRVYTTKQGLPDNIVSAIAGIPNTSLYWIGTQEGGIALYDREAKRIIPAAAKWLYGQVNDILSVSGKRAWVATEDGYLVEAVLDDSAGIQMHPYHYEGKAFKKLLADKAGNIWCATNHGLSMMTGEYLSEIKLDAPYSLYDATAMIWNDNALWIALKQRLFRFSLQDPVPRMAQVFAAKATITSLFKDDNGRLWIGTFGDGLYYEKGTSGIIKVPDIGALDDKASILSITGEGKRLWVAALKGVEELSCENNGTVGLIKHHSKKNGIGSDYVYQLYPDHKGNIWMATDGAGVCMYDGSGYHHWNASFDADGKVAYSITEDVSGDMWAGTMYKGLYHYHLNAWENLRRQEAQYADVNISAVIANATGQVVSVYQKCIDEWYPQSRNFRHFNSAMGIGIDSTSSVLNCAARDKAGNIYLPYQHGVLVFKDQAAPYDIRPGVHILPPSVYSRTVPNERHVFEHDENYISFPFDGIGFVNHERINYRYTLQGYNDGWVSTNDASASFPKLSPGNYIFRVQVSLNPAFEHPKEDDYSFTIATPFWRTDLFYVSVVVSVFLIGYLYIKLREKRLKNVSLLQQERMMFEYEHLKSQVNPHFLFNSLNALSILIEEKKENALTYTVNLADLYRNMLAYSRNDLISLKEECDILNSYVHIQQTRFGDALQVKIDIPNEVMEKKKIVPLALQLLVENAIKHNVVSLAQPLIISIAASEDEIVIRNFIRLKISKEKGAGLGLVNIWKRYGQLTKRPVTYGVFENEYIVKLPLL